MVDAQRLRDAEPHRSAVRILGARPRVRDAARVQLVGQINRTDPSVVPADLVSIPTEPGWNFVGVIDQDGDQTQANDGETLETGDTPVTAGDYLGKNKRAYTWDAVRSEFKVLEDGDEIKIGDGIWVYYGGGLAP